MAPEVKCYCKCKTAFCSRNIDRGYKLPVH